MSKARAVQVPGETAAPPAADVATELDQSEGGELVGAAGEPNAAAEVNDEVAQLRAQLAEANAKLAAKAAPAAPAARPARPTGSLPDHTEVDANKITSAVLTKTGYVVPATLTPRKV